MQRQYSLNDQYYPAEDLFNFVKFITKCKPPLIEPGSNYIINENILEPSIKPDQMPQVGIQFKNHAEYRETFFPLIIEECRQAKTEADNESSNFLRKRKASKWHSVELIEKICRTFRSKLIDINNTTEDYVLTAKFRNSEFRQLNTKNSQLGLQNTGSSFANGDLIYIINPYIPERPFLGVIQNIETIYFENDMSAENLSVLIYVHKRIFHPIITTSTATVIATATATSNDNTIDYTTINSINVSSTTTTTTTTVVTNNKDTDQPVSSELPVMKTSDNEPSSISQLLNKDNEPLLNERYGWADEEDLLTATYFQLLIIKNMTTSLREILALDALNRVPEPLHSLIITGKLPVNKDVFTPLPRFGRSTPTTAVSTTNNESQQGVKISTVGVKIGIKSTYTASTSITPSSRIHSNTNTTTSSTSIQSVSTKTTTATTTDTTTILPPPAHVPEQLWKKLSETYNSTQILAIRDVCIGDTTRGQDCALTLLQGPPGTGKTKTILGILSVILSGAGAQAKNKKGTKIVPGASLKRPDTNLALSAADKVHKPRVLVCAPSNIAVDEIADRLVKEGILGSNGSKRFVKVVRVGQVETLSTTNHISLEHMILERRKATMNVPGYRPEKIADLWRGILEEADVVCCTLSGAGSPPLIEFTRMINEPRFAAVVVDEAAQAVEPSTLIPIKYCPKSVILVGDPSQLTSTIFSNTAKLKNYGQSMFQRLSMAGYPVRMLDIQYRMHPEIAEFPSARYYQGMLTTSPVTMREKSFYKSPYFRPLVIHDVYYGRQQSDNRSSLYNYKEAIYCIDLYKKLTQEYIDHQCKIAIICPYRSQREIITQLFLKTYMNSIPKNVEIATVDAFQGREVDIAIFSTVRTSSWMTSVSPPLPPNSTPLTDNIITTTTTTGAGTIAQSETCAEVNTTTYTNDNTIDDKVNEEKEDLNIVENSDNMDDKIDTSTPKVLQRKGVIGFLKEWQRLNVAITRSKYALWIITDMKTLSCDTEWGALITHAQKKNCIVKGDWNKSSQYQYNKEYNNNYVNKGNPSNSLHSNKKNRSRSNSQATIHSQDSYDNRRISPHIHTHPNSEKTISSAQSINNKNSSSNNNLVDMKHVGINGDGVEVGQPSKRIKVEGGNSILINNDTHISHVINTMTEYNQHIGTDISTSNGGQQQNDQNMNGYQNMNNVSISIHSTLPTTTAINTAIAPISSSITNSNSDILYEDMIGIGLHDEEIIYGDETNYNYENEDDE